MRKKLMLVTITVGILLLACYIAFHATATVLVCLMGSDDTIRGIGTPRLAVREYYESHFPPICMPSRYWLFVSDDD